ncbi:MAG: hypothetical protein GC159_23520 [Phycisphaera sp.]|nr:hypothetical protein [Phycisphaera sp.]
MTANTPVVTRFAPSPTGALHVGGARTALYNWAYARRHGGRFILRLEDTDQKRSTAESTRGILRDLAWLGIDWDEGPDANADNWDDGANQRGANGPYFQSQRLKIYDEYFDKLIAAGLTKKEDNGALRFMNPKRSIAVRDEVLPTATIGPLAQEDFIIRKADGFPTYHFAVVVDDATMGVTHVIRGQEHHSNTPKHIALQDALGLPRPIYAHIPLILNQDNSKMSKRDKAKTARDEVQKWICNGGSIDELAERMVANEEKARQLYPTMQSPSVTASEIVDFLTKKSADFTQNDVEVIPGMMARELGFHLPEIEVNDFRWNGYLPESLCNYLALLGWNPGNNLERFDTDDLKEEFSLDRVGKSAAKFDREKLAAFNADRIAGLRPEVFRQKLWEVCFRGRGIANQFQNDPNGPRFVAFAEAYQSRSKTLSDTVEQGRFFFLDADAIAYDDKAVDKVLAKNDGQGFGVLEGLRAVFAELPDDGFGHAAHEAIKAYSEQHELGMGKVAQPVRVAVSGSTVSPPIDQTLDILGKAETLARIDRCLQLRTATS